MVKEGELMQLGPEVEEGWEKAFMGRFLHHAVAPGLQVL